MVFSLAGFDSSASLDMDWEKFTASVDVLEGCRATTMPAEASRPVLNSICTGESQLSPKSHGSETIMAQTWRPGYPSHLWG